MKIRWKTLIIGVIIPLLVGGTASLISKDAMKSNEGVKKKVVQLIRAGVLQVEKDKKELLKQWREDGANMDFDHIRYW